MLSNIKINLEKEDGERVFRHYSFNDYSPKMRDTVELTKLFFEKTILGFCDVEFKSIENWSYYDIFNKDVSFTILSCRKIIEEINLESPKAIFIDSSSNPIFRLFLKEYYQKSSTKIYTSTNYRYLLKRCYCSFKEVLLNKCLLLASLFSLIRITLTKSPKIAVWTGDYFDKEKAGDPRLGDFYLKVKEIDLYTIDFVRHTSVPIKTIFNNFNLRKRPALYYQAFFDLLIPVARLLSKKPIYTINNRTLTIEESVAIESYTDFYPSIVLTRKLTSVTAVFFKALKIQRFILWFYSSRTSLLFLASKKAGIKTIGFMHGMSVKSLMRHEYMPEYKGDNLGFSSFGVWTEYWRSEFLNDSLLYEKSTIQVSGPMREQLKSADYVKNYNTGEKVNVLFISENSIAPEQIIEYYKDLLSCDRFSVHLKVRAFGKDIHHESLKSRFPEIEQKLSIISKPIPDAFAGMDIVLGTHSTAVIEASHHQVPFLFLYTDIYEDYFSLKSNPEFSSFFLDCGGSILEKINSTLEKQNQASIRCLAENFIGNKEGVSWLVNEVKF